MLTVHLLSFGVVIWYRILQINLFIFFFICSSNAFCPDVLPYIDGRLFPLARVLSLVFTLAQNRKANSSLESDTQLWLLKTFMCINGTALGLIEKPSIVNAENNAALSMHFCAPSKRFSLPLFWSLKTVLLLFEDRNVD